LEPYPQPRKAFAELALPLFDSLYNFACWLASNRAEAEDLVQETFAKALGGFSSFEPGTNFRAWIFRILRNTFLNSRSGLTARRTVEWDEAESSGAELRQVTAETPESILFREWNQQAVRKAIEDLPLSLREVLLLADVEEMSYREISQTLDIPAGTVMSRLSRARRQLAAELHGKVVRT
jgi:RNA polymerase sigma-70 factor, ECF subfamily